MVLMWKIFIAINFLLFIVGVGALGKRILGVFRFRSASTPSTESIWLEAVSGIVVVGIGLGYYFTNMPEPDAIMWIGILFYFCGALLQILARRELYEESTFEERLGSGFEAAQLGLYGKLRFPSKTALLLMMIGFCFATGSIWALGMTVVLFVPSILYRISEEEQALVDKFGERYTAYQEDTKRIIPGIF